MFKWKNIFCSFITFEPFIEIINRKIFKVLDVTLLEDEKTKANVEQILFQESRGSLVLTSIC